MRLPRLVLLWSAIVLAGCTMPSREPPAPTAAQPLAAGDPQIARGLAFAEAQCSGCHAVRRGEDSPNPQAPGFAAVADEMGFTVASLREFFLDRHDFPGMMSIQLEEEEADEVAAYIMSLRATR